MSVTSNPGRSRVRRAFAGLGALAIALGAYAAIGWWLVPSLLVLPLRQAMFWRQGIVHRTVTVDGHAWPYLECGPADGPPVVLLHGFGTSKDAMMTLAAQFAHWGWHAVAPDLPGFGEHAFHAGAEHGPRFYADGIAAFMRAVGAERATVLGTSMGGALACELAIDHPASVQALMLLSPAGVAPPVRNAFMREVDAGGNPLDIADDAGFDRVMHTVFLRPPPVPTPYRRWFVDAAVARRPDTLRIVDAMKPFLMDGLRNRLGAVQAPTLVAYGTLDAVTDPSMMSVFAAELPRGRTALVPDAGHVAFADNFPGTMRAVREFMDAEGLPARVPAH